MGRTIDLTLPGDTNNLGPNLRLHWRPEAARKQHWRAKAYLVACHLMNVCGEAPVTGRVRVSFTIRRGRRLDPDNAASSKALKAALDGIVQAGMMADDTSLHCERGDVLQEWGSQWRDEPEVIVHLEEIK